MRIKFNGGENAYNMSVAITYLIGCNIYNHDTMKVLRQIKEKVMRTRKGNITIPDDDLKQIQFALENSMYTIKKYFSNEVYDNYIKLITNKKQLF